MYIGIDFGTSGCRGVIIDAEGRSLAEAAKPLPPSRCNGAEVEQSPVDWWGALQGVITDLLHHCDPTGIRAIALDGTSGTVLLTDLAGEPITAALMYNDNRARSQAEHISEIAPRESAAHGTGSGLAKALWLLEQNHTTTPCIHTQCDWLTGKLCGDFSTCDANNALKLGYDPLLQAWPDWLKRLGLETAMLPRVITPGTAIGTIRPELAAAWGVPESVTLCAGTTDSTAAFIASGANLPGEAVTTLGSTLVLKVLSPQPVFAPEYGVYSQPLGKLWLVGGGSNSGGTVLRRFFTDECMAELSEQIDPNHPSGLDYYPLNAPGERFPINDPQLSPRLDPRPADNALFFHGLLDGIARIEKQGYELLAQLGAPWPLSVRSSGGGAKNQTWTAIRSLLLGIPLLQAEQQQACYGAARLAKTGIDSQQK
jgi:D-ribulokinase